MPRRDTKGTKQLGAEITAELVDAFRAFAKGRGESVREHLEIALRRHLDNPPPPLKPAVPPLPPVTAPEPEKKPVGPRKKKKP